METIQSRMVNLASKLTVEDLKEQIHIFNDAPTLPTELKPQLEFLEALLDALLHKIPSDDYCDFCSKLLDRSICVSSVIHK